MAAGRAAALAAAFAALALASLAAAAEPALAGCENANVQPRGIQLRQAEKAILCVVNVKRARHGLGAVKPKPKLRRAALRHSRYMQRHSCFDHVCPGEADVLSRLRSTGYLGSAPYWGYGENIAWGESHRGTPRQIVRAWMHSPPHRDVILTGKYRHVGIGGRWGSPYERRAHAATFTADFGYAHG